MAGSALGLGMEKGEASNVSLRKSQTFRKTCIDWEACALTHQEWLFFPLTQEVQYYTCNEAFTLWDETKYYRT